MICKCTEKERGNSYYAGFGYVQCSCDHEKVRKKVTLGNEWIDFFIWKNWLVQWLKDLCYLEERVHVAPFLFSPGDGLRIYRRPWEELPRCERGWNIEGYILHNGGVPVKPFDVFYTTPNSILFLSLSLSFSVWCNKKPQKYFSGGTQFICVFTIFGFFLRKEDIDATTAVQQFSLLSFFSPKLKKKFVISPSLDGVRFSFLNGQISSNILAFWDLFCLCGRETESRADVESYGMLLVVCCVFTRNYCRYFSMKKKMKWKCYSLRF